MSTSKEMNSEHIFQIYLYKTRVEEILKSEVTLKKTLGMTDKAEEAIENLNLLDEHVKVALVTAFFKDLVQACLDRTATISAEHRKTKPSKKVPEKKEAKQSVDLERVTHYKAQITSKVDAYTKLPGNSNFKLSDIQSTDSLPEELKISLKDIFASEADMDNKNEVKSAGNALQILMPLASKGSIGSFYAWVSKKFRDKRKA